MSKNTSRSLLSIAICAMTILTGSFLAGCTNENDPESDGNHRHGKGPQPKVYTYKLSFGGDYIDQSEEPLFRADEAASYVGINVTRKEKDNPDAETEYYAYGVFNRKNNIELNLVSGFTYDFEATLLTDNTDQLKKINSAYQEPFRYTQISNNTKASNLFDYPIKNINTFIINSTEENKAYIGYLGQLSSGTAKVMLNNNPDDYKSCLYPRVHRYYGSLSGFDPSQQPNSESQEIVINVDYKCFGIEIDATSIPAGTSLTWTDISPNRNNNGTVYQLLQFPSNYTLSSESGGTGKWSDIYCISDLKSTDPESFKFRFTWDKGGDVIENFEEDFTVNVKTKKILKIFITAAPNTTSKGNIIINETGASLTDVEQTITYPSTENAQDTN